MAISVKEADSKGNLTNEERSLLHWADAVIAMDEQRRLGYSASSADLAHLQRTSKRGFQKSSSERPVWDAPGSSTP